MNVVAGMIQYIKNKSNSNFLIALFGVIYTASQIIIGSILHKIGTLKALQLQTTLSNETFKGIASQWIASGEIGAYYKHFYFDNFHPIWYSIFLSLLIARVFKINRVDPKYDFVMLTPFIAALCDFFENAMHLYFLADLNRATPFWVALSGAATNTKWFLAFIGVMIVAVSVVRGLIKIFLKKE
jgi:hypothetical protein